jgi:hypothetical protein
MNNKNYRYYIGIDTGVNTGFALWDSLEKKFEDVDTLMIHQAIDLVRHIVMENPRMTFVRVEDARKRKWFGNSGREQLQGAGSVKRDAKIWEDFLTDIGAHFEMVAPKNNKTKLGAGQFSIISKWNKKTNEHSRDAAMLVLGR